MNRVYQMYSSLMRDILESLSGEEGQAPEDTVGLIIPDRGLPHNHTHHGRATRWPAVVITGNPGFRTGGVYQRFGDGANSGNQPRLGALHVTIAHLLGDTSVNRMGQYSGGPYDLLLA